MKLFLTYCWRVLKGLIDKGVVVFDICAIIYWRLRHEIPDIPTSELLVVIALMLLYSTFKVWREEVAAHDKDRQELADLKNAIPEFVIKCGAITRYSVQPIIDETEKTVAGLKLALVPKNDDHTGMAALNQVLADALRNNPFFNHESTQHKFDRLTEYLESLRKYEKRLEHTYQIGLTIEGTRTDKTIQTTMTTDPVGKIEVRDGFVRRNLPKSYAPEPLIGSMLTANLIPPFTRLQSKMYLRSSAEDGVAYSTIATLNADGSIPLFEDECYIEVESPKFKLEFTIHSEKRHKHQTLTIPVDATGAEAMLVRSKRDEALESAT